MRKSWADQQGIKTGVMGEIINGITICEKNRATVFEKRREGIETLQQILHASYRRKGINAVLFGVPRSAYKLSVVTTEFYYAVYVQDGWLRDIGPEDDA